MRAPRAHTFGTPRTRQYLDFYGGIVTLSVGHANETAILAARRVAASSKIVALRHTYHGRSALGMTLTGQSTRRLGGVTEAGIVRAHNAYCYRCPFGVTYPACEVACNPHGAQQ